LIILAFHCCCGWTTFPPTSPSALLLPAPFDAEVGIAGRLNIGTERSVFSRIFKFKFFYFSLSSLMEEKNF
jgi:hypothetical protein